MAFAPLSHLCSKVIRGTPANICFYGYVPAIIHGETSLPRGVARGKHTHLAQTERHIKRLERIFKELDESPRGKRCVGMEGLREESAELIKEKPEADVLDAELIAAAQHVEHYEMAGYGCMRSWARQLGDERQADLLQETLDEEELTDKLRTELAETSINIDAAIGAMA